MKNIKTYGMELEFFFARMPNHPNDSIFLPDSLLQYRDGCGYLVEARGTPQDSPNMARYAMLHARDKLNHAMAKEGLLLENLDTKEIPREHLRLYLRKYGKDTSKTYFMGGHCYTSNRPRAGLHIHFGTKYEYVNRYIHDGLLQENKCYVAEICNMPRIIALMDKAFKDEIKAAKRKPGEYEIKDWGFEYRSLPATVNLDKVVNALEKMED